MTMARFDARLLAGVLILGTTVALASGCSKKQEQAQSETAPAPPPLELRGPQIIQEMVAAHGGLDAWRAAPTMSFTDQWLSPAGEGSRRSHIVVEQTSRRAYIDIPETDMSIGWDGEKAWSMNWPSATPVRFLVLLNYYFVNLPWLTQDPGVVLGEPEARTLRDGETEYVTVMMTFEPGTGDTPDDYYRLYIDPETKHLKATDYVVTYKALMGEGEVASPEHCLVYDEYTTVDSLTVPTHFTIYEGDQVYASCYIRGVSFSEPFDETRMTMPAGAAVDTTTP
jgi:hypothetical protein